jgi:SnoaL-like polyketide cyclase
MSPSYQSHMRSQSETAKDSGIKINSPLGVMQEHMRLIEQHSFDEAEALLSPDFQFTGATPHAISGKNYVQLHRELLEGIPDWNYNFNLYLEEEDVVYGTVAITGTHTGTIAPTFMPGIAPIAATGRKVHLPEEEIAIKVRDGLISNIEVETVPNGGVVGLFTQLGVSLKR